ncbi:acyltransferase [Polaromonas sp.]|uniref:acyltransferase n=1 Tax=Polaromonas sp. TaxID=1869339 RepID=UPI0032672F3B
MNNFSVKIKDWLLKFLGIHEVCLLKNDDIYRHISHKLLNVHLVFGKNENLIVGHGVVLNNALINTVSGRVVLMDHTFFGHGVSLLTGTHDYHCTGFERQAQIPSYGRDILIEEGVWICSNATVLGPCVIGRNSVIAAGAVVTGNVDANSIYAGVPARKIKEIQSIKPSK